MAEEQVKRDERLRDWKYFCEKCGFSKTEFYRKVGSGELAPAYRTGKKKGIRLPAWVADVWMELHQINN